MANVQIKLPDRLAVEAEQAGLLESEEIERMLRDRLRQRAVDGLFAAMERMEADGTPPMTPEEVEAEIRAMRDEAKQKR